jgi:transketolase
VYKVKKKNEKFVLSNGHAGMALYVILEKNGFLKDLHKIKKLSVHPDRDIEKGIDVSTGSLGQGLPIALGMALADRKKNVYCMISDGECEEGSIWEALKVAWKHKVTNLKIILNANGWAAYDDLDLTYLKKRIKACGYHVIDFKGHDTKAIIKFLKKQTTKQTLFFANTNVEQFSFLKGQDAHYYVMTQEDYESAINLLV